MKKRRFWVGLALCLAVCLLPGAAGAADTTGTLTGTGGTITWKLSGTTLTISGDSNMPACPETLPEDASSDMEQWFDVRSRATSVVISGDIKSIGAYAFYNCTKLTNLVFPDDKELPMSLVSVDAHAFEGCSSLKSADFKYGLQTIDASAFAGCSNLASTVIPTTVRKIGANAFKGSGLTSLIIPSTVTSIGMGSFDNCKSLSSIHYGGGSLNKWQTAAPGYTPTTGTSVHYAAESLDTTGITCDENRISMQILRITGCSDCYNFPSQQNEVLSHEQHTSTTVLRKAPTCTQNGHEEYEQCSKCSKNLAVLQIIESHGGHKLSTKEEKQEPTCTDAGWIKTTTTCENSSLPKDRCEEYPKTETITIDALGHQPVEDPNFPEIKPTCEKAGQTARVICGRDGCGVEIQASETISALEGDHLETVTETITKEATCTETGLKDVTTTCSKCGEVLGTQTDQTIDMAPHTMPDDPKDILKKEIEAGNEATCEKDEIETFTVICAVCGQEEKIEVTNENTRLEHDKYISTPGVDPTCQEVGYTDEYSCHLCNNIVIPRERIPFSDAYHKIKPEEVITKQPTCTEEGSMTVTEICTVCNKTLSSETKVIPVSHSLTGDEKTSVKTKATCTSEGTLSVSCFCSVCQKDIEIREEKIPAIGGEHEFGEWTVERPVVGTTPGVRVRFCIKKAADGTECGYADRDFIAPTYTVTLDPNGGALPEGANNQLTTGTDGKLDASNLPQDPTREGYRFAGWYTEKDNGERVDLAANTFTADTTVYAHWTTGSETPGGTFTVTFDANEGTLTGAASAVTGADGKLAAPPADPTRTGYTFDGWYTAKEDGEKVDLTAKVFTVNTTVYAHWTAGSETPGGTFTVTLDANGGTLSGGATAATGTDGKLSTLPAAPTRTGYTFDGWYTAKEGGEKITTATVFTKDTTVYAHWTAGNGTAYAIRLESTGNGTISASVTQAVQGTTVTLYADPDSDYRLSSLVVTDSDGSRVSLTRHSDSRYSFVMPASAVRASAVFVWDSDTSWNAGNSGSSTIWNTGTTATTNPDPAPVKQSVPQASVFSQTFRDIPMNHWAAGEIAWAYERGYMNGTGGGSFSPNRAISHQQLWTVLTRLLSYTNVTDTGLQTIRAGLIDGGNPNAPTTRQELVTALYRCAYLLGGARTPSASISGYADAGRITGYARDAMAWAVTNGIISGTADGRLNPGGTVTRAHFAVILYRFSQRV